jgi:hypothetical protein
MSETLPIALAAYRDFLEQSVSRSSKSPKIPIALRVPFSILSERLQHFFSFAPYHVRNGSGYLSSEEPEPTPGERGGLSSETANPWKTFNLPQWAFSRLHSVYKLGGWSAA